MVAAGDVCRRHHLRLKVRGADARVRVWRSETEDGLENRREGIGAGELGESGAQRRSPGGSWEREIGQESGACGADGTSVYRDEETPRGVGNGVLETETPSGIRARLYVRTTLEGDENGDLGVEM